MREKLGDWLTDIAKYMVTAMLLSTVFSDLDNPIALWFILITAMITLCVGLYLGTPREIKNKKKH